ncbi:uncharacterized protein METZ01_LOCUS491998, partial [marine metagenome]
NFTQHTISYNLYAPHYMHPEDVDSDGDMDVLIGFGSGFVVWYENDGAENFAQNVIFDAGENEGWNGSDPSVYSVYSEDVDGDGDMDLLSSICGDCNGDDSADDTISWYETDGEENFVEHVISTSADKPALVYAIDVDGDGDIDVLSVCRGDDGGDDDKVAWYENNGEEEFSERVISTSIDDPWGMFAVDVDSDGDIDVLSASRGDDKIAWYENKMTCDDGFDCAGVCGGDAELDECG